MGIFSKIKDWFTMETVHFSGSKLTPPPMEEMPSGTKFYYTHPAREGAKRITIDVLQNGDSVDIRMHGIGDVNVCLASFLTKGVSYAQEKFNEYQANKDTDAIVEEPKAEKPRRERIVSPTQRDIDKAKAWAKAEQAKRESK